MELKLAGFGRTNDRAKRIVDGERAIAEETWEPSRLRRLAAHRL
jgi:hypothetical protein